MKPTSTAVAVALALVVIVAVFIYPGYYSFIAPQQPMAGNVEGASTVATTTDEVATSTMTTENSDQLQVTDATVGTGALAEPGDMVTVTYVGALTDGKVFDASANHGDQGFTFLLGAGQVIPGWDQGIVGMKVGGKRHLVIPAALAYGEQGAGNGVIPPNATLVFDVELLKVQKGSQ